MHIAPALIRLLFCLPFFVACGGGSTALPAPDVAAPVEADSAAPPVILLPSVDLAPAVDLGTIPVPPSGTENTPTVPPDPSIFRLRNASDQPLYLRRSCDLEVHISPPDGEWVMSSIPPCACDCSDSTCGKLDCPGCPAYTVVPLAVGATIDVSWIPWLPRRQGRAFDGGSPICVRYTVLSPGPYQARVDTYATEGDAILGLNVRESVVGFTLQPGPTVFGVDIQ